MWGGASSSSSSSQLEVAQEQDVPESSAPVQPCAPQGPLEFEAVLRDVLESSPAMQQSAPQGPLENAAVQDSH